MDVLVVDDDAGVRMAVRRALALDGCSVREAPGGRAAIDALADGARPDVIVLDICMDDIDGLEVCRRVRAAGDDVPVLLLTANDTVDDRVVGLDSGADDYLVKPFAIAELRARVRALGRRRSSARDARDTRALLRFDDLTFDLAAFRAWRGGRELQLTRTEGALLECLLRHPGHVLRRAELEREVWGHDFAYGSNSLEVYVARLRRHLEAGGAPRLIQTVRGIGYALRAAA